MTDSTCLPENTVWKQIGANIDGEASADLSGYSVAMSSDGTKIVIGAPYNDANGTDSGHVRVYEYKDGSWSKLGDDIDGEAKKDNFGYSLAMSSDGTKIVIGTPYNDDNGTNSGHVRVYEYKDGSWSKLGDDIDGEAADDYSGYSLAMSSDGTKIVIGAKYNDGNGTDSGHVRVYEYKDGSWSKLGDDIDGEATFDESGSSVAMSSDGTKIVIGALRNDGNGNNSGHVRVYEYNNGSWSKLGDDIDGEAKYDQSGSSVAMSSDGTKIVIGALFNDDNGSNSGHVRVFEIGCTMPTESPSRQPSSPPSSVGLSPTLDTFYFTKVSLELAELKEKPQADIDAAKKAFAEARLAVEAEPMFPKIDPTTMDFVYDDMDGDLIPNKFDACPTKPGLRINSPAHPGPQDLCPSGCPEILGDDGQPIDSDQDGIPDCEDR